MTPLITGIHHVTAVSGSTQENIDFYTGLLGMRLVKATVNFDNPEVYHFYFGDEYGTPGTIMTTFPYGSDLREGRHGKGKINTTAFSIPFSSLGFWEERLDRFGIARKPAQQRFPGEVFLYLEDPDGMGIELVFDENEQRTGYSYSNGIPVQHSIRGIHHVELWLDAVEKTAALMETVMNHQLIKESANRFRYALADMPGKYVDLLCTPDVLKGLPGRGMVHHVAFATPDVESQWVLFKKLKDFGLLPTEIRDRKYFTSIYFNEPGGVVFEVATSGPGFTIDESMDELGLSLQLPPQFEARRASLNESLPQFHYPSEKYAK